MPRESRPVTEPMRFRLASELVPSAIPGDHPKRAWVVYTAVRPEGDMELEFVAEPIAPAESGSEAA